MRTQIPPIWGKKNKSKDPNAPKRLPAAFLFGSEHCPKIKEHPGLSIGDVAKDLEEEWNNNLTAGGKSLGNRRWLS
jgi:hypothetical protein